MIHSSKTAFVAVDDHRCAIGAFAAGDIVIVDEPALVGVLVREGSIDPKVVVDASLFTTDTRTPAPVVTKPDAAAVATEAEAPFESGAAEDDETTASAPTGHRPSAHRMQTARRGKAR